MTFRNSIMASSKKIAFHRNVLTYGTVQNMERAKTLGERRRLTTQIVILKAKTGRVNEEQTFFTFERILK